MEDLKLRLKEQIIEALNLEETTPGDIGDDMPLFGDGLGLDSIDALEIILILDKDYGIRFDDPAAAKPVFRSIDALAAHIEQNRK